MPRVGEERRSRGGSKKKEGKEGSLGGRGSVNGMAVGMGVVGAEGGEQYKAIAHAQQPRGAAGKGSARPTAVEAGTLLPPMDVLCRGGLRSGMQHIFAVAVCAWREEGGRGGVRRARINVPAPLDSVGWCGKCIARIKAT